MSDTLAVPSLPFPLTASPADGWRLDEDGATIVGIAGARTDFYLNPAGPDSAGAAPPVAPTLLGAPSPGDFRFSARVTVAFEATFDAGVLMLWIDETNWAKFCFEYSPAGEAMVVSVVTRGVSDDANAFVVPGRSVWLRVSRIDRIYAFHASTDRTTWDLVRVFTLGDVSGDHLVGFEVQSPTGDGCTVTFDDLTYVPQRLADLRDGS